MTAEIWSVSLEGAGEVPIAVRHRRAGEDLVVLMHGLGCAKESFDGAFAADSLARYSLLAFDFPEHGQSGSIGPRADIDGAAEVVCALLRRVSRRRVHLVCHSMGGAIGLVVAQNLPDLAGFVSVEGNLVADDCGLVSRGLAEQTADAFVQDGFAAFVGLLEASAEPSHVSWAQWYKNCNPRGLHGLARSLVEWCDNDKLLGIFSSLMPRSYVHGETSRVDHMRDRLGATPVYSVARSDHFPMLDNPDEFYHLIGTILFGSSTMTPPVISSSLRA